jgi:predicted DCC family thiol-disulfide oxidoreductase YuxK
MSAPRARRVARGGRTWTLLYDSDCAFCIAAVAVLLRWDGGRRLASVPIQSLRGQALLVELPAQQRLLTAHVVSPQGERSSGGAAAAPVLRLLRGGCVFARALAAAPRAAEATYDWVSRHRGMLSKGLPAVLQDRAREYVTGVEARSGCPPWCR